MITYVDLDQTLIYAKEDASHRVVSITVRPGASTFLYQLAKLGDVVLLTHAMRDHAMRGLEAIGPAAKVFRAVLSREDLQPIIDQIEAIDSTPGLRDRDRLQLYREIPPIAPPGFMVDDWEVGSWMFWIKATAIGIRRAQWIHVRRYELYQTNGSALKQAYFELLKQADRQHALGRVG